jgi:serine/threonine-protein kinase
MALVSVEALAEADGDPFLGTTVAGRFVILAKLAAGSMGTVYRSYDTADDRPVAVKVLRADRAFVVDAAARFKREAHAMSLLRSAHTVHVLDFGEIPEQSELVSGFGPSLYMAMELLDGESLGTRLKRNGRLTVDEALRIARHTLLSLAEAHDKGVIHRDLKPDNLFLAKTPQGEVCKLFDFGIAKVKRDGPGASDSLRTQAGQVFGTPRFMSPEQAQGKPVDARSDLYSFGLLLYQMLVGQPPFADDDAFVVMARHIQVMPVAPIEAAPDAGIPRSLSDLVMRVLSKNPNDRPPSATALLQELETVIEHDRTAPLSLAGGVRGSEGDADAPRGMAQQSSVQSAYSALKRVLSITGRRGGQ